MVVNITRNKKSLKLFFFLQTALASVVALVAKKRKNQELQQLWELNSANEKKSCEIFSKFFHMDSLKHLLRWWRWWDASFLGYGKGLLTNNLVSFSNFSFTTMKRNLSFHSSSSHSLVLCALVYIKKLFKYFYGKIYIY